MGMLAWLMNLGFAGGGVVVSVALPAFTHIFKAEKVAAVFTAENVTAIFRDT